VYVVAGHRIANSVAGPKPAPLGSIKPASATPSADSSINYCEDNNNPHPPFSIVHARRHTAAAVLRSPCSAPATSAAPSPPSHRYEPKQPSGDLDLNRW
jgi:hypothetical protein